MAKAATRKPSRSQNIAYLLSLIRNSTLSEVETLRQLCTLYHDEEGSGPFELLGLLESVPASSSVSEAALKVNSHFSEPDCVTNVSSRLVRIFHESLTLQANLRRRSSYGDYARVCLEVANRISLIKVLWGKGILEKLPQLLISAEKKARKYELLEELIAILELKQEFYGLRKGRLVYEKTEDEIEEEEGRMRALKNARRKCRYLSIKEDEKGAPYTFLGEAEKLYHEISRDYDRHPSGHLRFYRDITALQYHQQRRDFAAAVEVCRELISFISKHKHLFSRRRHGIVYVQLANSHLMAGDFEACLAAARKAERYLPEKNFNRFALQEVQFLACFYQRELEAAQAYLLEMRRSDEGLRSVSQYYRCLMYQAAICILEERFTDARLLLEQCVPVKLDRDGWSLGLRLLELQADVAEEKMDQAEENFGRFARHIYNLRRESLLSPRWEAIYNVLQAMSRNAFDFKRSSLECFEDLKRLAPKSRGAEHEIRGAELINVYHWFLTGLKDRLPDPGGRQLP